MKQPSKPYVKDIDRIWAYILKNAYFYAEIPYALKHFVRIFQSDELRLTNPNEVEIKRVLGVLVKDKKLIKVKNGEYMIHPQSYHNWNLKYVAAFSK